MTDPMLLHAFITARNGRRSAERGAQGFVSGQRVANLREAQRREQQALQAIANWVEDHVRQELAMPPTPRVRETA